MNREVKFEVGDAVKIATFEGSSFNNDIGIIISKENLLYFSLMVWFFYADKYRIVPFSAHELKKII